MKKLLLLLLLLPLGLLAQTGLIFEHGLSWEQIQAKAKAENKYIFMDAFTTWCGPCMQMAKNIFPLDEVGKAMNPKFLNVKVQLDTTDKDNEEVKQWYADAHAIMKQYNVRAFPTYLYFSPEGKIVHRAIGSSTADKFIAKAADATNPEKQYYVLLDQYTAGNKDPEFLRKLAMAAQEAYDVNNFSKLGKEYLGTQSNLLTEVNINFLDRFTESSKDPGFAVIMKNVAAYDKVKGTGAANKRAVDIIMQEEVFPVIYSRDGKKPDWNTLETTVSKKYPKQAAEVLSTAKVTYFQSKDDWAGFQSAIVHHMKKYGSNVSPNQLNEFAWAVFENCKDMTCVTEALQWSKRSFKGTNDPMYIDTYANLLYKMGKKKEAIQWQEKAIALVPATGREQYTETLEKMKKGEKTWKHD